MATTQAAVRPRSRPVWYPVRHVLIGVGILAIWEALVQIGLLPDYVLSSPSEIPPAMGKLVSAGSFWSEMVVTLQVVAVGMLLGGGAAILTGVVIGRRDAIRRALDPVVLGVYSMPSIALVPLFLLWLGFGIWPAIVVGALHAFPPMLLATYEAIDQEDRAFANSIVLMGGRFRDVVRFVRLPGAVPRLLPALRQSLATMLAISVASGMIAPTGTIGHTLVQRMNRFDAASIIALVLILGAVGVLFNLLVDVFERRVRRWRPA
jgi:NitT/TauT family transport system permease protein